MSMFRKRPVVIEARMTKLRSRWGSPDIHLQPE